MDVFNKNCARWANLMADKYPTSGKADKSRLNPRLQSLRIKLVKLKLSYFLIYNIFYLVLHIFAAFTEYFR